MRFLNLSTWINYKDTGIPTILEQKTMVADNYKNGIDVHPNQSASHVEDQPTRPKRKMPGDLI